MTEEQHQTPPLELVEQWASEHFGEPVRITNAHSGPYIATKAADWAIKRCVDWLYDYPDTGMFPPSPEWLAEKIEEELLTTNNRRTTHD